MGLVFCNKGFRPRKSLTGYYFRTTPAVKWGEKLKIWLNANFLSICVKVVTAVLLIWPFPILGTKNFVLVYNPFLGNIVRTDGRLALWKLKIKNSFGLIEK